MAQWNYTLKWGKQLREAIYDEDATMVVKCLIACYRELLNKLSDEDREWYEVDIEEAITDINDFIDCLNRIGIEDEDEDEINGYLENFYDLCDELRVWVALD
jgi:hypothetical protein